MSAVNLLQPILDGVQRNNFFNGRLLSAEDLRAEQIANRQQEGQLARAIGDGVAWGLDVSVASARGLTVTVREGLALNRHLDLLSLESDTEVALVPALPTATAEGTGVFGTCDPPRASAAYTGAGVYVLVVAPASGYRDTALISDPNTAAAGRGVCGARFSVEGVRFRLVPMELARFTGVDAKLSEHVRQQLPPSSDAARERLRNALAHLCYGTQQLRGYFREPLAPNGKETTWRGWGALDAMRALGDLTDCDVPLALIVLTSTQISFADMWSVRRRIVGAGAVATWRGVAGPRRMSEAEAAFLQFQAQLDVVKAITAPASIAADSYFEMLPPAGWLPTGATGLNWKTFLGAHAPATVTPIDAALVRGVIQRSWMDEPFALTTTPPVPLRVYEVPSASYVVFARSPLGNARIIFSPPPAAGETVEVQITAQTGGAVHGSTLSGSTITIPEIAPGLHTLTISAPDYVAVPPSEMLVIGGRTVDVAVQLTPQPNGSIVVDAIDKTTDDRIAASKVLTITATAGGSTFTAVAKSGRWVLSDLPAATYTITGAATGYQSPAPISVGPTAKGTVLDAVLGFEPSVHAAPPPAECVALAKIEALKLSKIRLCMVLKATEFEEKFFYGGRPNSGEGGIANATFRLTSRRDAIADRGGRYVTSSGEIVYVGKEPRKGLEILKELTAEVVTWLQSWRDWIADELALEAIKRATPLIYIDPKYRLPKAPVQVPALPPAYAFFGHLAVPLSIRAQVGLTPLPVAINHVVLPWVMRETFEALSEAGVRHLNDLAWAWRELVIDATGDPPDTAPYLIDDAAIAVRNVNAVRGYYPGMTPQLDAKLKANGFPTDLSIANATTDKLTQQVGNAGFAVRLIYEARQIVPKSSWSLEALPLAPYELFQLYLRGIESQGVLMEYSNDLPGKEIIAEALGIASLPATMKDEIINPLVNEAAMSLTRNAVVLAPAIMLSLWTGTNPTTAAKLQEKGITSVDELAHADEDVVASAANLTTEEARTLKSEAQAASLTQANVEAVLAISPSAAPALNEALKGGDVTLGRMLDKTAADLKTAFGDEARAGSILNGLKQGFMDRGIR